MAPDGPEPRYELSTEQRARLRATTLDFPGLGLADRPAGFDLAVAQAASPATAVSSACGELRSDRLSRWTGRPVATSFSRRSPAVCHWSSS